jgi:hypothetical protein
MLHAEQEVVDAVWLQGKVDSVDGGAGVELHGGRRKPIGEHHGTASKLPTQLAGAILTQRTNNNKQEQTRNNKNKHEMKKTNKMKKRKDNRSELSQTGEG